MKKTLLLVFLVLNNFLFAYNVNKQHDFSIYDSTCLVDNEGLYVPTYWQVMACDDDYFDDMDGVYPFNLDAETPYITGGDSSLEVTYHETENDADTGVNAITNTTAYENQPGSDHIYARVLNPTTGDYSIVLVNLQVNPNPTPLSTQEILSYLGVMSGCESYVYGQGAVFDLTQWEIQIITGSSPGGGTAGLSATYYTNYNDAETETNSIPTPTAFYSSNSLQTIYVRVTNVGTGCYTIVEFDVELFGCELPQDNLVVEAISESCVSSDNGMIQITANNTYAYEVSITLNGNPITLNSNNFTDTITIPSLASGTYYVCVTATDVNVTQCFDVYIEAVENLAGFSGRMGNVYTLELSGSKFYHILMNDELIEINSQTATELVLFEYELNEEVTTVRVTTNKECQGKFEETVFLNNNIFKVFPNPVSKELHLLAEGEVSSVKIYDSKGKIILNKSDFKKNISVEKLRSGMYFIRAIIGNKVYTSKFIKK